MTLKGPFQPQSFYDSLILFKLRTVRENCLSTEIGAFKTSLNPGFLFFGFIPSLEKQHFLTSVCVVRISMLESQGPLSCGTCDHFGMLPQPGERGYYHIE